MLWLRLTAPRAALPVERKKLILTYSLHLFSEHVIVPLTFSNRMLFLMTPHLFRSGHGSSRDSLGCHEIYHPFL